MRDLTVTRVAGWGLALAAVAAAVASLPLDAGLEHERDGWLRTLVALALLSLVAGLGLLVVERSPVPSVGLLLAGFAALLSSGALADRITAEVMLDGGADPWWARMLVALSQCSWPGLFGTIVTLAVIFPTGRPLTRRWRRLLVGAALAWGALMLTMITADGEPFEPYEDMVAPIGVPEWVTAPLFAVTWPLTIASLPLGVAALVVRYRRSRGVERQQLTWLLYVVGLLPLLFVAWGVALVTGNEVADVASGVVFLALAVGVPAAVAVALTRYRLYDIDWIVNRTLVYAAVTSLLAAAWAGVALGLGVLAGRGSPWVVAAATAAVALVFSPLRRRVQALVDRRFARARFEAVGRLRAFEEQVREGAARPEDVVGVLREALGDPAASLALRLPGGELVDPAGRPAPADGRATSSVVHDGAEIAVLAHDEQLAHRPHLVGPALAAASLTIELARLQTELRRQLVEVERSRERIVRAGYEERRRLERDLHDGAQQRLVGLGIRLRRIQRSLPPAARVLEPALDESVAEVGKAIVDLRAIAAGLRPSSLDEGLAAALAELARSTPIPVDVAATRDRLPGPIEAAAYFVACEAVTNAVKHGSPSAIRIDAEHRDDAVRLVVEDDGVGGAAPRPGSGLAGLVDRLGAHGGTLVVDSVPGAGTRVEAVIPCAS